MVLYTLGLYTFDREHEFATGPEIFNPVNFDARQWVKAYKAAGMTGLLLTCKHHEGFCLWLQQIHGIFR
ncbi:MAG: alpha-L-fucosidase [Lachnospiraceae bacterium]